MADDLPTVKFDSFFPVQVKKQDKYNLYRWTVNGRNNLEINRRCFQILENFTKTKVEDELLWRELLFLWSSDFRTHTTEKRYLKFIDRLDTLSNKIRGEAEVPEIINPGGDLQITEDSNFIDLKSDQTQLVLNKLKGLTIESYRGINSKVPLIGHVDHGVYDDISFGSDFLSGYTVCYDVMNRQYASLQTRSYQIGKCEDHIEVTSKASIHDQFFIVDTVGFYPENIVLKKHITFLSGDIKVIHPLLLCFSAS